MKNEGLGPEQKETIVLNPKELWLVDDNTDIARSLLMSWRSKFKEKGLGCQVFETGQSTFQEFQRRIGESVALPTLLIVDGQLEKDEEESEFRLGSNLIRAIRSTENIPQPTVIAHSNSERFNQDMIEAGANLSITKGDRKILEYFQGMD